MTETVPKQGSPTDRRRRRQRSQWLIVGGVLVVLAAALAIVGRGIVTTPPDEPDDVADDPPGASPDSQQHTAKTQAATDVDPSLTDDDGRTLWASPTAGAPLALAYLPPGVQIVLALRPAELVAHPEGEKVVAALGPTASAAIHQVEQAAGLPLADMEQLVVGWQAVRDGGWDATLVVTAKSPVPSGELDAKLAGGTQQQHEGQAYVVADDRGYYRPNRESGRVLVIAPAAAMPDIIALAGRAPPLVRDVERLVAQTDASRHVTLLVAPNALFSDAHNVFTGEMSRLRNPLARFLGDGLGAVSLSLHWDANFFIELRAVPTLDLPPDRLADALARRLAELPDRIEDYVLTLTPSPFGRRAVARLPGMVRKLSAYTRQDFDADQVIVRCYLPAIAGHNLLMAAELTLTEVPGAKLAAGEPASAGGPPSDQSQSLRERLRRRTSLRFTRDTLETALRMLSDDVGVAIIIRGPDLQLEGITKNQSFGINVADQPAEEILVEILRLANPDKLATGPSDPRQKLVYVIEPRTLGGPEAVFITTRARALQQGETLPGVFLGDSP